MRKRIALIGRSGAGKTEVAKYLIDNYNFEICNTGKRCRELAMEFFESNSKETLQHLTDAINLVQKGAWLKVAIKNTPQNNNIIIDSIRFNIDYDYVKKNGYLVWKIECPIEGRLERLKNRGQIYDIKNEAHSSENELDDIVADVTIDNSSNGISNLHKIIDAQLQKL